MISSMLFIDNLTCLARLCSSVIHIANLHKWGEKITILLQTERNKTDSPVGQCPLAQNWIQALVAETCMAVQVQQSCIHFSDRTGHSDT